MKDLSLHLLDVAQNSVTAQAKEIDLCFALDVDGKARLTVRDNGRGMSPEFLACVTDPFTTTRTTRKVGLGLPLLRMAAEQTGGGLEVESEQGVGTTVTALFDTTHIDCPPEGDFSATVSLLIQGAPDREWTWQYITPQGNAELDTRQLRQVLGEDVPLSEPAVVQWIKEYLQEQVQELKG